MVGYVPDETIAHRLDPRSKIVFQVGFAAAAFTHTTPEGLLWLSALTAGVILTAGLPIVATARSMLVLVPFLVGAPLLSGLTFGSPWFVPADAIEPTLSSYRIVLVIVVGAAYVRTTTVRESRAAIQRTVPGRPGAFLAIGVSFVFRFLPLLRSDLRRIREAQAARLGIERPLRSRIETVTIAGLDRAFGRADRLSLALRARCFAWNPTLPRLRLSAIDLPVLLLGVGLAVLAIVTY